MMEWYDYILAALAFVGVCVLGCAFIVFMLKAVNGDLE